MQMKDKKTPFGAEGKVMSVISLASFLSQLQLEIDTPSTSSTVWLTKAVDTSVSLLVHVVVYTVPTCPADAS